ncbi:MAG: thioredoxin family protein, partial [Bacilli bacterium]|nr:thioredoxin family protein [Bacilli bacterium]
ACKGIRPKLKKISEKYKVEIKYVDIRKLKEEQIDTLGISATPTIIFYTDGEEETTSARIEGNLSEKKIIEKFQASNFIK